MSYYRPSFSQTVAMSRGGGRGYSSPRGSSSYRGSSRGGSSSWNDRGGGRGSFSSRGGRFSSSWGNNNSFDSRSRYSSSGGGDRYSSSSRGRNDDSTYRRSYRSDGPNSSYSSSRDGSGRSPDRKRIRTEAPSSRRSHGHEGGYGGGDSYGGSNAGRYESGHGSYSDRRSFNEDRRTGFRREEYRKPAPPPPLSATRSPRGSFRGSRVASRGARGSRIALARRRLIDSSISSSSYMRKRGAALRSTSDYLRRLRITRIRSAAARRTIKKSKSSEKDSDKEDNWDEDLADKEKKEDGSDKEEDDKEKRSSPAKKSPKKEKDKDESDKEEKKSASEDDERPRSKYTGRPFIRLTCIHCGMKCVTFREYSVHLFSGRHITAMRKIALRQKAVLARMRQQQRNAQRELEKSDDTLGPRTIFCPLCKLNYRQLKSKHQMSEAHRNMKKFLMPYCRVCHITFKSPMLYENHMCSLEHIKRKAQTEVVNGDKHGSDKDPESPAEEDLENFMTLDSVGDVDEDEEGKTLKTPPVDGEAPAKPKETINVGVEHVKKVEVYYCDLCHIYLSRHEDEERTLKQHCRSRLHLQRYVRYKEDKDLRRQAERIHRKSQETKEAKEKEEKEKEKVKTEKSEEPKEGEEVKSKAENANEEEAVDDKMWADVDKDLGEILAEVNTETGNKSDDDEDEDSRPDGERYDRFRLSEKGGDAKQETKGEPDEKESEEKEENADEEEEKPEDDKEKKSDEK